MGTKTLAGGIIRLFYLQTKVEAMVCRWIAVHLRYHERFAACSDEYSVRALFIGYSPMSFENTGNAVKAVTESF